MNLHGFNAVDAVALVIVLIGTVIGLRRGLTGQIALLLGALTLGACIVKGFTPCHDWLIRRFAMGDDQATALALAVVVAIPVAIVWQFSFLANRLKQIPLLAWLDHVGGAVAGGISAAAFVVLAVVVLNVLPPAFRPPGMTPASWVMRHLIGVEKEAANSLQTRIMTLRDEIQQARERETGKRERWQE